MEKKNGTKELDFLLLESIVINEYSTDLLTSLLDALDEGTISIATPSVITH